MSLGRVLKNIRIARNLSRDEVANTHYSVSHLAAVEQGVKRPSVKMLMHVADKLKVSLEMLIPEVLENPLPVPEKIRLARALCNEEKYDLAMEILRQAEEEDQQQGGQYRVNRLEAEALIEHLRGNYDQATRKYAAVSRIRERGGNPYLTAKAYYGLARVELERGRTEWAIHWLFLSWDRLRPDVSEHREFAVELLQSYADELYHLGRFRAAQTIYETAREYAANCEDDSHLAEIVRGIGHCLKERGNYGEAAAKFRLALQCRQVRHTDRADTLRELGTVLRLAGKPEEAMSHLKEAQEMQEKAGANPLSSMNEIIACLLEQEALDEELDRWCAAITEEMLSDASPESAARYGHLRALTLHRKGDSSQALQEAKRAFDSVPAGRRRLSSEIMISILEMARDQEDAADAISWVAEHIQDIADD